MNTDRTNQPQIADPRLGQGTSYYGTSSLENYWLHIDLDIKTQEQAAQSVSRVVASKVSEYVFFLNGCVRAERMHRYENVLGAKSISGEVLLVIQPWSADFAAKCGKH